jgi:hypothetical protein
MTSMRLLITSVLLASGCTGPRLADVGDISLNVTAEQERTTVSLAWTSDSCDAPHIELTGTFGGNPMQRVTSDYTCNAIGFVPPAGATFQDGVVEIADDSVTITATFDPSDIQTRFATHPTWEFIRGTTVSLDWSQPDDLTAQTPPWFALHMTTGWLPGTISGTHIDFQIPPDAIAADNDVLLQFWNRPERRAVACVNAVSCSADLGNWYFYDAMVRSP